MKQLLLAVVVLLSFVSGSFAEMPAQAAPAAATIQAVPAVKPPVVGFTGKVVSVVVADPAKGVVSTLEVVSDQGQKVPFQVIPATTITDVDGKALALGALANGTAVEVAAVVNKGVPEALAVKVLK